MPQVSTTPKASAYDTHVNREASSKAFEKRAVAQQEPAFKAAVGTKTFTPAQVQEKRTVYYTTVYRDRYIAPMPQPSYGPFAAGFLGAMVYDAAFAHHRSDDADYRRWRRDADDRARSDERLRDQLAELDRKVDELKSTPKDPSYVPKDVPPEVVFSEESLTAKSEGGHSIWYWTGLLLAFVFFGFIAARILMRNRRFA